MAAAPQYATMTLVGLRTRKTYSKDVYCSDVVAAAVNFDGGAGSGTGSPAEWTAPEPIVLQDFSILTGMTDTKAIQLTRNGVPTGDILRYANYLNTLNSRPVLTIGFKALDRIAAIQIA